MPRKSLTFKDTYTFTHTQIHSFLHTDVLRHSLSHMTMSTNSFTQGLHYRIDSGALTHTFTYTYYINVLKIRNLFTYTLRSIMLKYSLTEENTLRWTYTLMFIHISPRYTHLLTSPQQ